MTTTKSAIQRDLRVGSPRRHRGEEGCVLMMNACHTDLTILPRVTTVAGRGDVVGFRLVAQAASHKVGRCSLVGSHLAFLHNVITELTKSTRWTSRGKYSIRISNYYILRGGFWVPGGGASVCVLPAAVSPNAQRCVISCRVFLPSRWW